MRELLRPALWVSLILLMAACGNQNEVERRQLGVAEGCDAAVTSCHVREGELDVILTLGPGAKPLQPFPVAVDIEGATAAVEHVVVDFQMQGMDMGRNRYQLQPDQNSWQGTATLPVCIASRMDWLAIVEFTLGGESVQAIFPFHSESN